MDRPCDFFVSYTAVDVEYAEWIAGVLEHEGYGATIQAWDFRPGNNFAVEMQRALQSCKSVIAVLSPDYLTRPFPLAEWTAAFADDPDGAKRRIIPVMVRDCEPTGLLAPLVHVRIVDMDETTASVALLAGVREGRAKPAGRVPFPGTRVGDPPSQSSRSAPRPRWRRVESATQIAWHRDLDERMQYQTRYASVEIHLTPTDDSGRLLAQDLRALAASLPAVGRANGIFTAVEQLNVSSTVERVAVYSTERGAEAGLAVMRTGQRSAWAKLPNDMLGAVLDEDDLTQQVERILRVLVGLDLPEPAEVVTAVGIDPAQSVNLGRVSQMPRTQASMNIRAPQFVRPSADEALPFDDVRRNGGDVAAELVARLVGALQSR